MHLAWFSPTAETSISRSAFITKLLKHNYLQLKKPDISITIFTELKSCSSLSQNQKYLPNQNSSLKTFHYLNYSEFQDKNSPVIPIFHLEDSKDSKFILDVIKTNPGLLILYDFNFNNIFWQEHSHSVSTYFIDKSYLEDFGEENLYIGQSFHKKWSTDIFDLHYLRVRKVLENRFIKIIPKSSFLKIIEEYLLHPNEYSTKINRNDFIEKNLFPFQAAYEYFKTKSFQFKSIEYEQKKSQSHKDSFRILCIGDLKSNSRFHVLASALNNFFQTYPNSHRQQKVIVTFFTTNKTDFSKLERLKARLLSEINCVIGQFEIELELIEYSKDLEMLIACADLVTYLSSDYSRSWPLSVNLAIALTKPVILTEPPKLQGSFIQEHPGVFYVSNQDTEGIIIKEIIREFFVRPDLQVRISDEMEKFCKSEMSITKYIEQITDLITENQHKISDLECVYTQKKNNQRKIFSEDLLKSFTQDSLIEELAKNNHKEDLMNNYKSELNDIISKLNW